MGGIFNPKKHGKSQMLTLSRQFANYCQKEFWNISKILSVLVAPYWFLSLYDGILWLWWDILPKMCDWVREKKYVWGEILLFRSECCLKGRWRVWNVISTRSFEKISTSTSRWRVWNIILIQSLENLIMIIPFQWFGKNRGII